MKPITVRAFESFADLDGLTERSLRQHFRLYETYVEKCNELGEKMEKLRRQQGMGLSGELQSLKVDFTYALAAVKNHEIYFGMLGGDAPKGDGAAGGKGGGKGFAVSEPQGALAEALKRDFGSVPQFLVDLKHAALNSSGWAWTTLDMDHGHLFNYGGTRQHTLPVWNAVPLLAVDLYIHAYMYDFGNNKAAYIDAVVGNVNWAWVGERYGKLMKRRG